MPDVVSAVLAPETARFATDKVAPLWNVVRAAGDRQLARAGDRARKEFVPVRVSVPGSERTPLVSVRAPA